MKRNSIAAALAVAAAMSLAACQATPEKGIVVQKDTERLVQQAEDDTSGVKAAQIEAPAENYTWEKEGEGISVHVDAPVNTPASGKVPTARVSAKGWTQEQITGFFNYLFPGEKPALVQRGESAPTKSQIQEVILYYKKCLAEGTVNENTVFTEEELQEEIARLEAALPDAPESVESSAPQMSDGTLQRRKMQTDMGTEEFLELNAQGETNYISVGIPANANSSLGAYMVFAKANGPGYTDANPQRVDVAALDRGEQEKCEKMQACCDGFFAAGGIGDVTLSGIYKVDAELDGKKEPKYKLIYTRRIGDTPGADMSDAQSYGEKAALPWGYEHIYFYVDCMDSSQIEFLLWESPTETGEIINEDTGVLAFEEIKPIFEQMIQTAYAPEMEGIKTEVDIQEIQLSVMRIREQNASGKEGVYTPAWIFYGNAAYTDTGEGGHTWYNDGAAAPQIRYPVLALNAMDGSVIDAKKGY